MIAAVYKITSDNGQTHDSSHIYMITIAVLCFPFQQSRATLAMREDSLSLCHQDGETWGRG